MELFFNDFLKYVLLMTLENLVGFELIQIWKHCITRELQNAPPKQSANLFPKPIMCNISREVW